LIMVISPVQVSDIADLLQIALQQIALQQIATWL
jgi:hypothetical protein